MIVGDPEVIQMGIVRISTGVVGKGEHIYVQRAWARLGKPCLRNQNAVIGWDNPRLSRAEAAIVAEVDRPSE